MKGYYYWLARIYFPRKYLVTRMPNGRYINMSEKEISKFGKVISKEIKNAN